MTLADLKKLTPKQVLIAIGGLTLVLAALASWLLYSALGKLGEDPDVPAFLRRSGDENSRWSIIVAKQAEIDEQNAIGARLKTVQAVLQGMKDDIEAARKRLPTEAQKADVRQLIEDLGRQVGSTVGELQISSVSIRESGGGRSATDYKTIEYSTQVNATMDALIQFINLIERNERFMTVEGIQLASGGVELDRDTSKVAIKPHTVTLRIVTYIDTSTGQGPGSRRK